GRRLRQRNQCYPAKVTHRIKALVITESLLQTIFWKPPIRDAFIKQSEPYHDEENAKFLFAVLEFRVKPTLDVFATIYEEYIKVGSQNQVNVSEALRQALVTFMEAQAKYVGQKDGEYHSPLPVPRNKLNDCFAEVLRLYNNNLNSAQNRRPAMV